MKFRAELAQIADPEVVWGSSEFCSICTFQPQHVVWGNPLRGQPWTTSQCPLQNMSTCSSHCSPVCDNYVQLTTHAESTKLNTLCHNNSYSTCRIEYSSMLCTSQLDNSKLRVAIIHNLEARSLCVMELWSPGPLHGVLPHVEESLLRRVAHRPVSVLWPTWQD